MEAIAVSFLIFFAVGWAISYACRPRCPECGHKTHVGAKRCGHCSAVYAAPIPGVSRLLRVLLTVLLALVLLVAVGAYLASTMPSGPY